MKTDSEEETKAYQAIWNAEEYIDEEPRAFTVTLLPETTIPEETNIERRKIIPQQPFKNRSEIQIGEKTKIIPKTHHYCFTKKEKEEPLIWKI